jgi:hypothetical protein
MRYVDWESAVEFGKRTKKGRTEVVTYDPDRYYKG